MHIRELSQQWDTIGDAVRGRRLDLGLTQREVAERTGQKGSKTLSGKAYGRIEGGHWIPRDKEVIRSLALALEIDEELLQEYAEITRDDKQLFSREYSRVLDLINAMLRVMDIDEQAQTFRTLEKKIALFEEPIYKLARNFTSLWKGEISVDDAPRNGLRPLRHYLRPFCQEDMIPWRKENIRSDS